MAFERREPQDGRPRGGWLLFGPVVWFAVSSVIATTVVMAVVGFAFVIPFVRDAVLFLPQELGFVQRVTGAETATTRVPPLPSVDEGYAHFSWRGEYLVHPNRSTMPVLSLSVVSPATGEAVPVTLVLDEYEVEGGYFVAPYGTHPPLFRFQIEEPGLYDVSAEYADQEAQTRTLRRTNARFCFPASSSKSCCHCFSSRQSFSSSNAENAVRLLKRRATNKRSGKLGSRGSRRNRRAFLTRRRTHE